MELCIKLMTSNTNLPPPEELRRALDGLLACVLNTEFIIFNAEFIILNAEFIILNEMGCLPAFCLFDRFSAEESSLWVKNFRFLVKNFFFLSL